jgi:glutamate racemase
VIEPLSSSNKYQVGPTSRQLPVGVFDSGLGGLTVVQQLFKQLPWESIIYFGDTARVPYGSKSVDTVRKYAIQIVRFLEARGVKLLVIACNTVSSVALEVVAEAAQVPVIGVIEPGALAAAAVTRNHKVGVIGTTATIRSGAYEKALQQLASHLIVLSTACPLFVPLVEEGWLDHPVTEQVAREYLQPVLQQGIDTLILGCTHYPLLKTILHKVAGNGLRIVDTAIETARQVKAHLGTLRLFSPQQSHPQHFFYVSDFPQKFEEVAARFLGEPLSNVTHISVENY